MFGYHDSGDCHFDLWAPGIRSASSNRAFSGYTYHEQEIEELINKAVRAYYNGESEVDITGDSFLSKEDYEYIANEVSRRIN